MRPPTTGPAAVEIPTVAPKKPKARPRSAPRNNCWMSAEFCGARAPAATPCARRAATSMPTVWAAPAAALHTTKPASAARNIVRRPTASPSRPAGTSARPNVNAYPDTTHWIAAGDAPSPSRIEGSATATMLTSSRLMNPAVSVTDRARQRRGSGVYSSGSVPACRSSVALNAPSDRSGRRAPASHTSSSRSGYPPARSLTP